MRVVTFAFSGMSPFHLSVPGLIFETERKAIGLPHIDYALASLDGNDVKLPNGLLMRPAGDVTLLAQADLAIIPSWTDLDGAIPQALVDALNDVVNSGGRAAGLCLGAYALAGAGLLDGKEATTHWSWADHFSNRFPEVRVRPDMLYVESGLCLTSAGVAAALDACLHLVRTTYGETVAARLARAIVMAPHRSGGQAQFIERPVPQQPSDKQLAAALDRIGKDAGLRWSLDSAADAAGMSRRTFTRRLKAQTGQSFSDWLAERRVSLACEMLERTGLSVDAIAETSGLGSPANLRTRFARYTGLTPTEWRARFAAR
ncbi:helix-turn-helix domain-containing protein [Pelagibacterium limicola]|uniref:helix-turn-helix domain-containing protein n=1 Tax=Pelagibacterium limicola TaxID=2791022 RepID=UPI0018AF87B0